MPLRINAKNYFLTYAQAERIESKEHLLWFLRDKVPTPERWCIGEETHADGGVTTMCYWAMQTAST